MIDYNNVIFKTAVAYGLNIFSAVAILIVGNIAAKISKKVVTAILIKTGQEKTVVSFIGNIVHVVIMTFAIIATLAKFGIQTASFIAVIGSAGIAIGLALQGSLANFASGFLLLVFRPFKAGDIVEAAGVTGCVEEILFLTTVLISAENVKIIIPNGKLYSDIIKVHPKP
ncbi:mechanosensitive ion channel family protein [Candidatus Magnetomonas plexicatena]|uniref:mechanosensitive ion channel family protein n=1 Tax=Candidatus Magnetomonas plexicatena TaxID=2552947 RepID=UPI00110033E7|nr:mechanosensitive ion channel [Nitrospirales bacterium LBB_01]